MSKYIEQVQEGAANSKYTISSALEKIKYLHHCLFSPANHTLLKGIQNGYLPTLPNLTETVVQRYLPNSPETIAGNMCCPKQGIRPTSKKLTVSKHKRKKMKTIRAYYADGDGSKTHHLFCYAGLADTH